MLLNVHIDYSIQLATKVYIRTHYIDKDIRIVNKLPPGLTKFLLYSLKYASQSDFFVIIDRIKVEIFSMSQIVSRKLYKNCIVTTV